MLSDERLREMLAGTEGVTPGPHEARFCPALPLERVDYGVVSLALGRETCRVWDRDDAEHYARCDPDTIRSILTELVALRKANAGMAEAMTKALFAVQSYFGNKGHHDHPTVVRYEAALQQRRASE